MYHGWLIGSTFTYLLVTNKNEPSILRNRADIVLTVRNIASEHMMVTKMEQISLRNVVCERNCFVINKSAGNCVIETTETSTL